LTFDLVSYFSISDGGISETISAPLYLRTLWRYTNAVIIIIINEKKMI